MRDELRVIRLFHQLGVRMMHLTYNRRNPLGDGAGEPNDGGLSDFGRQAIAEMNRLGVIVDVAHSGWRTSLEAAKASSRPMVASHTTCAGLYKHFRGKPDEVGPRHLRHRGPDRHLLHPPVPRRAAATSPRSSTTSTTPSKRFGAEHVAIGTDVAYVSRNDAAERAKVPKRTDGRSPLALAGPRWEHLWPGRRLQGNPPGRPEPRLDQLAAVHRRHGPARPFRRDHPQDPRRERPPRLERQHAGEVLKGTIQRPDPGGLPMHARAMVLLTLLSSAGSLVLTASFAEEPSSKSVPTYKVVAGWPESSSPIKLGQVSAVATDASDRVFVFHRGEPPVVVFDRDGKYLRSWGEGLVKKAHGLRIDREQNVWTTDVGHHLVRKFDHEGTLLMTLGRQGMPAQGPTGSTSRPTSRSPPRASSSSPTATATRGSCCSRRTAATSRSGGRRARAKASSTCRTPSSSTRTAGSTWATARTTASRCSTPRASSSPSGRRGAAPYGLFLTADRRLFVADGRAGRVTVLDHSGKALQHWGEPGTGPGQFAMPHAVCVDSHGDVYVAEINGRRLQKFTAK